MITHNFIRSNLETIINLEHTALKTLKIKICDLETAELKKQDLGFEIQRIHEKIEAGETFYNFELYHSINGRAREFDGKFATLSEACEKLLKILKDTNFIKWKSYTMEVS